MQLFGTFGADTLVVELLLLYDITFHGFHAFQFWRLFTEEVDDLTAFLAVEVYMAFNVAIITNAMFVDGNHLCCLVLAQHAERVIYCGATQGWHLVRQCLIHVIYRWMDGMVDKVIHNGQPLH